MSEKENMIKEIIAREVGCSLDKVIPTADLANDLGADSLDKVELIMAIEDEFDIVISDDDLFSVKTVKDLVDLLIITLYYNIR